MRIIHVINDLFCLYISIKKNAIFFFKKMKQKKTFTPKKSTARNVATEKKYFVIIERINYIIQSNWK